MRKKEPKEQVAKRGREYRARVKAKALDFLGKKCSNCGYDKCLGALDFHHLDPSEKEFSIHRALSNHWGWDRVETELKKCIILCANCHREVHYNGPMV